MPLHDHPHPDVPAVIMGGSEDRRSYAELDRRSRNLAAALQARGIGRGGHVAVLLANQPEFYDVNWATQRSGIYLTPVNWHLAAAEAGYIIEDCGARALVTSAEFAPLMTELADNLHGVDVKLVVGGEIEGFEPFEDAVADRGPPPVDPEVEGSGCSTPRAPPGAPRASCRRSRSSRSAPDARLERLLRRSTGSTRTPSTCARPRCTTPPRSAGA